MLLEEMYACRDRAEAEFRKYDRMIREAVLRQSTNDSRDWIARYRLQTNRILTALWYAEDRTLSVPEIRTVVWQNAKVLPSAIKRAIRRANIRLEKDYCPFRIVPVSHPDTGKHIQYTIRKYA